MERFDGCAALVTGAGQGIGEAIARRLVAEGARVLVTDRDLEAARASAGRIGDAAVPYRCEVTDGDSVRAAVDHAAGQFGRLDVLVNNAAHCTSEPLRELTEQHWLADLDATLLGAFRCAKAALPYLIDSGRGAIVNIGSVNGAQYFGNTAYSAAKAGLASLTRSLAVSQAGRGVRVNLVMPGTVRTPNWAGREEVLARAAGEYPLGRVGEPDDIAAAVAFLASTDAAWITGVELPVDGGLLVSNLGMNRAFGIKLSTAD
jgi:meso-butanediol dehydrogenase / (S,S)-butanediol dehydrogenase / diacetyl reductase